MTSDHTQQQTDAEQRQVRELSLQRTRPPLEVPGYEARQFLGSGAYGEVWVAVDHNTGRRVAIKFYTQRSGVDWSLLSREVEKLVFLSADRYVVQLLDVGWDADPPYYVMEYVANGSLEQYLEQHGTLPVGEAVEMFRDVVTGLLHAHGKGVLHCDLKPANVLLDQDMKPRLADFGQSRLSHEQTPALGTLFYMAPEQADLEAMPDARWDVYAVGALLYRMLTGGPPHRNDQALSGIDSAPNLAERLQRYRRLIRESPSPLAHREIAAIDRELADIIDRCLAVDPERRFANVQSIVDALQARDAIKDRRPLVVLGLIGPLLFLVVMTLFGWQGYLEASKTSDELLRQWALESSRFAAKFVSEAVARRIERYFLAVKEQARDPAMVEAVAAVVNDTRCQEMLERLADDQTDPSARERLRKRFVADALRQHLQEIVARRMNESEEDQDNVASWFVTDRRGLHLAADFGTQADESAFGQDSSEPNSTVGKDYSWRSYFHGGPADLDSNRHHERPPLRESHLSAAFLSTRTSTWKVAVSTPVRDENDEIIGTIALTVELGRLGDDQEFPRSDQRFIALVDGRSGDNQGVILQHPLFNRMLKTEEKLPDFSGYRVPLDQLPDASELQGSSTSDGKVALYRDPLGSTPGGEDFDKDWIAVKAGVNLPVGQGSPQQRLFVLVQESYDSAATPVDALARRLRRFGLWALILIVAVGLVLWYIVVRALRDPNETLRRVRRAPVPSTPIHSMETLELPQRIRDRQGRVT